MSERDSVGRSPAAPKSPLQKRPWHRPVLEELDYAATEGAPPLPGPLDGETYGS